MLRLESVRLRSRSLLRDMVELERRLALDIVVPVVLELVKLADDDLISRPESAFVDDIQRCYLHV